tara:strand:- start:615 stop:911 length:297 start_codon:yes stop_codon:yes gene_type:complete
MSNKPIKFSKDELSKVQEVQKEYNAVQDEFGKMSIARIRIQQELESIQKYEEDLRQRFIKNQEVDKKTLDKVTAKYGDGTLDPNTGVFTPAPSEQPEK